MKPQHNFEDGTTHMFPSRDCARVQDANNEPDFSLHAPPTSEGGL